LRHAARELYRRCKTPIHYSRLPEELKLARQFVAIAKQLDIVQAWHCSEHNCPRCGKQIENANFGALFR
jgi:hypothetical protein